MDKWKAEMERVREKRRLEERRSEKRKSQKKEDADARKVGKSRNTAFFQMICSSGGSKSRLAKAAGAEPSGQMRDEKVHAVVARSTISKSKCTKTHQLRTTFGSWDVKKVQAVVARSTFRSQNVQNTPCSDHFWKLRCWKSARCCGGKHISKSKCTKHTSFEPLLEVAMSKKCTLLWREAMRSTFRSQKCKKLTGTEHFWTFRCAFAWQAQGIVHLIKNEQNVRV